MESSAYLCRALSTALTFLTDYYHALSSLRKAIHSSAFKQETNVYLLIKIFYLSRIISACLCSALNFFSPRLPSKILKPAMWATLSSCKFWWEVKNTYLQPSNASFSASLQGLFPKHVLIRSTMLYYSSPH